jgi:hypothetical protein
MNYRWMTLSASALLLLSLVACGAGAPATSAPADGGGAVSAPTAAPAQPTSAPPAAASSLDIGAVNLCSVLPRAELAALAGGTPYEGAEGGGPSCIYTIDPGDGTAELYSASVSSPDLVQPLIDYVRQYEQADWPEGIGDVAYMQPSAMGDGFDMVVLVEGAYGLSIGGPRPEVLEAAARLIVERLAQ